MTEHAEMIYSDEYLAYNFGNGHPFNPLRLNLTRDLIESMGVPLLAHPPRMATKAELKTAHASSYIEAVQQMSITGQPSWDAARFGLGTDDDPVFLGMHEAASLAVGGSLVAAERIVQGQSLHALNLSGGLHHAMFASASGFCLYNDVVVAVRYLRAMTGWRVLYLDIDAHHGDGVQAAFYDDPNVVTISFHETGKYLFPGTGDIRELGIGKGYGSALNIPLEPFTDDQSWLECLMAIVPPVLERFQPNIIVSQHGCDGHAWDPLTDLSATTQLFYNVAQLVHQWAHKYTEGKWLAVGGGGYELVRVVPRAWTLLWMEMTGQGENERTPVPDVWRSRWQSLTSEPLPMYLVDRKSDFAPGPRARAIRDANRHTVTRLQALSETTLHPFLAGRPAFE